MVFGGLVSLEEQKAGRNKVKLFFLKTHSTENICFNGLSSFQKSKAMKLPASTDSVQSIRLTFGLFILTNVWYSNTACKKIYFNFIFML